MKGLLFIVIILILFFLLWQAWNKESIDIDVSIPKRKHKNIVKIPAKIPKKKPKSRSKKEDVCRDIFEQIFKSEFPTKRPSFLKNPDTGRNLELDGYNNDLRLAFEYNGHQHLEFPNTFHRTFEDFQRQVKRDQFKKLRCEELGIVLVTIPHTVDRDDLEPFIRKKLQMVGYLN